MPQEKEIAIRLVAEINQQSTHALMNIVENNLNQGFTKFKILLSSPGGSVQHGITVYNFLKGIPASVDTYNIGSIDSIAAVIYCAGSKRFSVPNGRFLIHSVTWGAKAPIVLEEKQLKEIESGLKIDRENIAQIVASNCSKTQSEIEKIMLDGKMFSPQEAKEFGLVNEISEIIIDKGVPIIGIG